LTAGQSGRHRDWKRRAYHHAGESGL